MSNVKNERVYESDKLIKCLSILYKLVNDDGYFLYNKFTGSFVLNNKVFIFDKENSKICTTNFHPKVVFENAGFATVSKIVVTSDFFFLRQIN